MVYRTALSKAASLEERRLTFAVELARFIVHERDIIFLDETSFHGFMYSKKAWAYADVHVEIPINNKRVGCTLFGAIG